MLQVACLPLSEGSNGKDGLVLTREGGQGPNLVIHHEDEVLENMNEWSLEQHGLSGLTERSRESTISMEQAEEQVQPPLASWLCQAIQ